MENMENKKNNNKSLLRNLILSTVLTLAVILLTIINIYIAQISKNENDVTQKMNKYKQLAETYTVFYIADDTLVSQKSVAKNGSVSDIPSVPSVDNKFGSWAEVSTNVTSDKIVFANYVDATVAISGKYNVGEKLTATFSTTTTLNTNFTFTWYDGNNNVLKTDANNNSGTSEYTLLSTDNGKTIKVVVTCENYVGNATFTDTSKVVKNAKSYTLMVAQSGGGFSVSSLTINGTAVTITESYPSSSETTLIVYEGDVLHLTFTEERSCQVYSYINETPYGGDPTNNVIEETENDDELEFTIPELDDDVLGIILSIFPLSI